MAIRIGINGFGRMGRLALRAAWTDPGMEFVHVNDPAGDAEAFAQLLNFDSVHGRWAREAQATDGSIVIDGKRIGFSRNKAIADTDWSGCDVVIEASGKMKTVEVLEAYLAQGVQRVPLANASLTDCVFEVERATSAEEVNALLKAAAGGELRGILGYEQRPLVSVDYRGDARSSIVDALSTLVVNGTQVKIYAWYDNEWGYVNRTVELARLVGGG